MSADTLDIVLLGKEYSVTCRPEDREGLLAAVSFLDDRLNALGARTNASGEKLAVMTALNIAHEFLRFQARGGFDIETTRRTINHVNERLEEALSKEKTLL